MSSDAPVTKNAGSKGAGKGPPLPGKGSGKGVPPPPPKAGKGGPPMMPGDALARRPSGLDLGPKLRPLFWSVVNQVTPDSIWADLCEPAPFDKALLERQFTIADSRTPTGSGKSANGTGTPRSGSEEPRKRLRVLDDRSSQMLAIAFKRLPPPERVAEMVDTLEDFPEGLTSEGVLALHGAVSEHKEAVEQIRLVVTTQESIAQLDMPERFLLRLSSVPFCDVKLACGKLIVGSAKELIDLRMNGQKVGVCCQEIRKSGLLRKWISTSFAVGNMLNRGTARSGVRAVVLPDSLLKLNELRGNDSADDGGDTLPQKGPSALDFVAQALVDQGGVKEGEFLREAENLLAKARAAAGVSLEETQTNCRQVNAEATEVKQALSKVPASPGMECMLQRVGTICEEAELAVGIAQKAKDQLAKAQAWSSCKGKVNSNEWFASWVQFLELLPRAIVRAEEAKVKRLALEETARLARKEEEAKKASQRPPLGDANTTQQSDPDRKRFKESLSLVKAALAPRTPDKANEKRSSNAASRGRPKVTDDEAQIDSIDWSKINELQASSQPAGPTMSVADYNAQLDKENPSEAKKPSYKPSRESISAMWDKENCDTFF